MGADTELAVNPADKQRIDDILARCKQEAAEIQEAERELGTERKRIEGINKAQKAAMVRRSPSIHPCPCSFGAGVRRRRWRIA